MELSFKLVRQLELLRRRALPARFDIKSVLESGSAAALRGRPTVSVSPTRGELEKRNFMHAKRETSLGNNGCR
jgi:hypothetical protein